MFLTVGLLMSLISSVVLHPATAVADLNDDLKDYLDGKRLLDCDQLYGRCHNHVASGHKLDDDPWFVPALLYLALHCAERPQHDAQRFATNHHITALVNRAQPELALLTILLGAQCYIKMHQYTPANTLMSYGEYFTQSRSRDRYDSQLLDLLDQSSAYVSLRHHEARVGRVHDRPDVIIAPLGVTQLSPKLNRPDEDALSAAVTWLILAGVDRLANDFIYPRPWTPLSIEFDLALRFSDGRVCGVNSRYDPPYADPERKWPWPLPAYLKSVGDTQQYYIHGYVNIDPDSTSIICSEIQDLSWTETFSVPPYIQRANPFLPNSVDETLPLHDMGRLALLTARGILAHLHESLFDDPIPAPVLDSRQQRLLPAGQGIFLLFVEAVGFETRNNLPMAARRYRELLRKAASDQDDFTLQLVRERLAMVEGRSQYDTPGRFLAAHDEFIAKSLRRFVK